MTSFLTTSNFSSYFSKKDNKYDIPALVISFVTFCALSTFCWIIFAVNITGWLVVTVIGGTIAKCRQELVKSLDGTRTEAENMLDHRLSSSHFEDFRLSTSKDGLPSIPSYRSLSKPNKTNKVSFDSGSIENIKLDKNKTVLAPSEYSLKRNEKRTKNKHIPDIPSQLGPNRQKESVDYYPSVRHSHQPKSKLSATEKMIESTAAYRVFRMGKGNNWLKSHMDAGDFEEFTIDTIDNQQKDPITDCTLGDPLHSREPIKDSNVRLDQERPKISRQERRTYNASPARSLHYARQYLTVFLTIKKQMNL